MDHFELFEKVTGRVSLKTGKVHETALKEACRETGAQYHEAADEILITGKWEQVSDTRTAICSGTQGGCKKRTSSSSSDYSEDLSSKPDGQMFDTVPQIAKYMKRFCADKLKTIEQSHQLKITWSKDYTKVHIKALPTGNYSDRVFNRACDQFADLYRHYHQTVTNVNFNLSRDVTDYSNEGLKTALCSVTRHIPGLIVERAADDSVYTLWGTTSSLNKAKEWIRGELGVTVNKPRSVSPKSGPKHVLSHETSNKLKVVVYEGDITKENADIIVNACNKYLDHAGGVSYSISKTGGPTIQQESHDYVSKNGTLRTGEVAVTGSGFLQCKHIAHAVGPQWNEHGKDGCIKLFRKMFMNVYQAAVKVGAMSIAMPAISSGIFGVPKEVCAEAAFSFVDEIDQKLASDTAARPFEIRLVNLDGETAKIFCEEYKKWLFKGRKLERRHSISAIKKEDDVKPVEKKAVDDLHKTPRLKAPLGSVLKIARSFAKDDSTLNGTSATSKSNHGSIGTSRTPTVNSVFPATSATSRSNNEYTGPSGASRVGHESTETSAFSKISGSKVVLMNGTSITQSPSNPPDDLPSVSSSSYELTSTQSKLPSSSSGHTHTTTTSTHSQNGTALWTGQFLTGDKRISKSGSRTTVKYDQNGVGSHTAPTGNDSSDCSICFCPYTDPVRLQKCGHTFCRSCIERAFTYQKKCPVCLEIYGVLEGDQPDGTMEIKSYPLNLPGYQGFGCYVITYNIPSGFQDKRHPKPGHRFTGTKRQAFLPATKEGKVVLNMLKKAFDMKLIFTVGRSNTTGQDDCVIWNDIHHKTSIDGGPVIFGYPDQDYLNRVKDELKAKGIVPE